MRFLPFLLALAFASLTWQCQPFRLAVPEPLQESGNHWAVDGRHKVFSKQKLRFGPYRTEALRRSWTSGQAAYGGWVNVLWTRYEQRRQNLRFELADDDGLRAEVFGISHVDSRDRVLGDNPSSVVNILGDLLGVGGDSDNNFALSIYTDGEKQPWELLLDNQAAQRHRDYTGFLAQSRERYYTLHPINRLEKNGRTAEMPFGAAGLEFRDPEGRTVAALSLLGGGHVYLAPADEAERLLLASACAALLLQENI
jgi:hypothetical protein